jgi:hypothetical protein
MYDLYIPSRHEWGMYMVFFFAYIPWVCKEYVYICINADLLPPVVAMHACIVLRLCEHGISPHAM